MNKDNRRFLIIDIIALIILIIIDQFTKKLAVIYLMDKEPFSLIKGVLEFYYLPGGNKGAAFGLFQGQRAFFIIIAFLVIAFVGYLLVRIPAVSKYRLIRVMLIFVAAGGLGNMIDRVFQSYVVDFIYIRIINFPVFNVADMYVTCGVIILGAYMIFKMSEEELLELNSYVSLKKSSDKNAS
ncbi:MAG: signal peptidase II [Lachnospiraceae bacterium]|nr:signal peptidase II [Lachnospiraceae bacterium]